MKKLERFICNIHKEKSTYNATFYDFNGCVSAGKTLEDTIDNAKIALQMHIEGMIEDGEKIPEASCLEKIAKETHADIRVLIEVVVSKNKKKRIDITLDESLINIVDNLSPNRSEFISLSIKDYIEKYYNKI